MLPVWLYAIIYSPSDVNMKLNLFKSKGMLSGMVISLGHRLFRPKQVSSILKFFNKCEFSDVSIFSGILICFVLLPSLNIMKCVFCCGMESCINLMLHLSPVNGLVHLIDFLRIKFQILHNCIKRNKTQRTQFWHTFM